MSRNRPGHEGKKGQVGKSSMYQGPGLGARMPLKGCREIVIRGVEW